MLKSERRIRQELRHLRGMVKRKGLKPQMKRRAELLTLALEWLVNPPRPAFQHIQPSWFVGFPRSDRVRKGKKFRGERDRAARQRWENGA